MALDLLATVHFLDRRQSNSSSENEGLAPTKRVSWNRSLFTRGRTSIAATACVDQPKQRKPRRNAKPPLPAGEAIQPADYDKKGAYFQEVDAFELLEEIPSLEKPGTWTMGTQVDKKYAFPGSLSKILETPALFKDAVCHDSLQSLAKRTPGKDHLEVRLSSSSAQQKLNSILNNKQLTGMPIQGTCEDIESAVSKLSLTSRSSSRDGHDWNSFSALLTACGQSVPSTLTDMLRILSYWDRENITKAGEGTYAEAFKVGSNVWKIVPFDGYVLVNGEVQKKSEELLKEVVLTRTLNHLRGRGGDVSNACSTFIQTIDLRVCQGCYDSALISAWESWDAENESDNDNPKVYPADQCYVVFVQEDGGEDLDNFVLWNFDEAKSLLVQVTLALAVAEAAYEFEHRDLHWGNILLRRKRSATLQFILEGKKLQVQTFGLLVSIIDFTLSRINTGFPLYTYFHIVVQILQKVIGKNMTVRTGEGILFLDLSSDPELFEGPKGNKQANTYRKMKDVTDECWEGSFPKTNVLWLQFLVSVLLSKKYEKSSEDKKELRSLKKRLNSYGSAKEAVSDPFFRDLLIEEL